MLRYLAHPYQLLGVAAAVVLGLFGHNLAQAATARLLGDRAPARQGWLTLRPTRHVEALGAIAAMLAYYGWSFPAPVPLATTFRRGRPRVATALLAGPLLLLGLTFVAVALSAHTSSSHLFELTASAARSAAGLTVLSALPVPPLTGGRVLFLYAPRTAGWQRARYQLLETQAGGLIVLAVVLLPVVFPGFPDVVAELADPLLRRVAGIVG